MPSVINTNIASLNTQRNLTTSQASLNVSIQRLSTGLRVNSAKDDAAGLAIAERMGAQVRGLTVAARNANDAVSLAQTAEGALGKIGDMVQRMRELAVQSVNATNSQTDRDALQAEVAQLKAEVDRVAQGTNFNGSKLLNGSFAAQQFQVGANAGESITVATITDAQLSGMGFADIATDTTAGAKAGLAAVPAGGYAALAANDLTIKAASGATVDISGEIGKAANKEERIAQVVSGINKYSAQTKVSAYYDAATDKMILTGTETFDVVAVAGSTAIGITTAAAARTATAAPTQSLVSLDVSTAPGANTAIQQADAALKQINTARANLGAVQSRFENAIANIQLASENTTAAKSRIMDTDFASETANLTRAQILQQAGTAMLSQANQGPQSVLSLLR
jgi:flagellin